MERGTGQGDPFSPPLFNACLEKTRRPLRETWRRKKYGLKVGPGDDPLTNLQFALPFDRDIDNSVIKINTEELITKASLIEAISGWIEDTVPMQSVDIKGPDLEPSDRFIIHFRSCCPTCLQGPWITQAC